MPAPLGRVARAVARVAWFAAPLLLACGDRSAADGQTDTPPAAATSATSAAPSRTRGGRLSSPYFIELDMGDAPHREPIVAYGPDGAADTLRSPRVSVADTTVARVVDGGLVGVTVGHTTVHFEARGRVATVRLTVRERIFDDTLRLAPGEVRAWNLPAGRYRIAIAAVGGGEASRALEFGAESLRCAPDRRETGTIHCLAREATRLVLKHNAVRPGDEAAQVSILRVP